jgi:hypothetical protein
MMAPLLLPSMYGIPLPAPEQIRAEAVEVVHAMRARPAGRFASRLIEQHRPLPAWMT